MVNLKKNKKKLITHVPIKTKIIRYNNNHFTAKKLNKEILKRSKPRNKFNKNSYYEIYNIFQMMRFNLTMIFFKFTD